MPKTAPLRIAVVEDHEITRDAFVRLCDQWPHGEVVLRAEDGIDYEEQAGSMAPVHIAVVDLRMPRRDGYETVAWIREHQPDMLILVISFNPTDDMVYHALQAGANGVVDKGIKPIAFHAALDSLRTTGNYANDLMMRQITHKPDAGSPLAMRKKLKDELTTRETEFLLKYIDDESPSRHEVAEAMGISPHTAETHRKNIVEKTAAHTRVAMVKMALRFGLITL